MMHKKIITFLQDREGFPIRLNSNNQIADPDTYRLIKVKDHAFSYSLYHVIPEESEVYDLALEVKQIQLFKDPMKGIRVWTLNGIEKYYHDWFGMTVKQQILNQVDILGRQYWPTALVNIDRLGYDICAVVPASNY